MVKLEIAQAEAVSVIGFGIGTLIVVAWYIILGAPGPPICVPLWPISRLVFHFHHFYYGLIAAVLAFLVTLLDDDHEWLQLAGVLVTFVGLTVAFEATLRILILHTGLPLWC